MSRAMASVAPENRTIVRVPPAMRAVGAALTLLDRVSQKTAARVAANLFLTPRRLPRPASEIAAARRATREKRELAGKQIVTWSWGEGAPVLLAHGWEGRGTQLGSIAETLVQAGFRVIAPDFPAHGDSVGRRTNLLEFAAVIEALVTELDPVAIVAHSFGAAATTVALRNVSFSGRLVYIAPPEDFHFFTETFGAILGLPDTLADRMEREVEQRFDIDWKRLRLGVLAPAMTAPLLVIHDEDDTDVPPRFGRALAEAWPGAELLITRGLGHRRILRSTCVLDEVTRFVCDEPLVAADGTVNV